MAKGTPSMGRKQKKTHIACRRCGRRSFHIRRKVCSACGFGKSAKLKAQNWQWKSVQRQRLK